jgi:hypothetical protein
MGLKDIRDTEVAVGGYGLRSGTLIIAEATDEAFTFAYATENRAVCIDHGDLGDPPGSIYDPPGVRTIPLEELDEKLANGIYQQIDIV